MSVIYKEAKTIKEFIDAVRIRVDVFIVEQKCKPGWEPDEEDKGSIHFIAVIENEIVSTARVRQTGTDEFKIERMATKKEFRGKGISSGLVKHILADLKKLTPKRIWMESQVQVQGFYEQLGFKIISKEPYDLWDTGILHIEMEYSG